MQPRIIYWHAAVVFAALGYALQAQPTAHYPPGIHGLNAGSFPPPGLYLRDYNYFYASDQLNNGAGNPTGPANFNAFTYANVIRPIWISDWKVLDGYFGADVVVPLIYRQLRAGTFDNASFGLGDIFVEPSLSWHFKQLDFCFAVGEWMPTGDSGVKPTTRAGLGYWTTMFTLGGIWFIDAGHNWSVSALNRYEINTEKPETDTTTGNAWTLEWGVGRKLTPVFTAGVAGYYQAKVTADSGAHPQPLNRVAAIGPELDINFSKQKLFVALRYDYEFFAENRAQGHTASLVLTKRF